MNNLDKHDIEHLLWMIAGADDRREQERNRGANPLDCPQCARLRGILAEMQVGVEAVEEFRNKQRELIHNHEGVENK